MAIRYPLSRCFATRVARVDRQTLLWTIVVFFGATIVFRAIRDATEDDPIWVTLLLAVGALAVMIAAITYVVRRRGD
jgi:uncharacterized membrane protein YhaH (DUF805 family)